jgi:hypothetical protein
MEGLTSLLVEKLHLILVTHGHAIGSCVFHLLKISTSIRSLFLDIREAIKVFFTYSAIEYFGCLESGGIFLFGALMLDQW